MFKLKNTRNNYEVEGPSVAQSLEISKGLKDKAGSLSMENTTSLPQLRSNFTSRKASLQPNEQAFSQQAFTLPRKNSVYMQKKSLMAVD